MNISDKDVIGALVGSGFVRINRSVIFATEPSEGFCPAYIFGLIRKDGFPRISGGIGFYFPQFEQRWRSHLGSERRKVDHSLPLAAASGNFHKILPGFVTAPIMDLSSLQSATRGLFETLQNFPKTPEDLVTCAESCTLGHYPIADYLHIQPYSNINNLYFRKSCAWLAWLKSQLPSVYYSISECLTEFQRNQIALHLSIFERDFE